MTFTVASSIEELLADATDREPMLTTDGKSGARFERVVIGGLAHVVKHLHVDDDWIMRSTGDLGCRQLSVWSYGILAALPACIDPAVVGAAQGLGRNGWGAALLMRDVSPWLVPEGDDPVPLAQHRGFLDHMAALHSGFWGWNDTVTGGLLPPMHRFIEFNPDSMSLEARLGWPDAVPPLIIKGWAEFAALRHDSSSQVMDLLRDPTPLVDALRNAPQTLLHGDWKMGNLGTHEDGRTILLDWAMAGQGCPTAELARYLSLNSARLPESKEAAMGTYREALERHGVATEGWWERAMDLSLLGGLVWFGWEKALGGEGVELDWWLDRAGKALRWL